MLYRIQRENHKKYRKYEKCTKMVEYCYCCCCVLLFFLHRLHRTRSTHPPRSPPDFRALQDGQHWIRPHQPPSQEKRGPQEEVKYGLADGQVWSDVPKATPMAVTRQSSCSGRGGGRGCAPCNPVPKAKKEIVLLIVCAVLFLYKK